MKFILNIFLLCAVLLFLLIVFLYACKRLDISISGQTAAPANQQIPCSISCGADYEQFACLVFRCLDKLQGKCGLICPLDVCRLYCANKDDRIQQASGYTIFRYEIKCNAPLTAGGLNNVARQRISDAALEQLLSQHLPDYMSGGYFFQRLHVWSNDKNEFHLEVIGVGRNYLSGGVVI